MPAHPVRSLPRVVALPLAGLALGAALAGCRTTDPEVAQRAPAPASPHWTAMRAEVVRGIEARRDDGRGIDEFDEIVLTTDMDGQALGAFLAAVDLHNLRWKTWQERPESRHLEALRTRAREAHAAKDTSLAAQLEEELQGLEAAATQYRTQLRRDVVSTLSLPHQRDWATEVLWGHWGGMEQSLRHLELTPAQARQARSLVRQHMNVAVTETTLVEDPCLWQFRRRHDEVRGPILLAIAEKVLSPTQRAALLQKP